MAAHSRQQINPNSRTGRDIPAKVEKMKTETYELPSFWASPLINGDYSGMEDTDIEALEKWLEKEKPGYCVSLSDESFFAWRHDASAYVLACDCSEFTFIIGD